MSEILADIQDAFIQELTELWVDLNYRSSFASQADFRAGHTRNNPKIIIAGKNFYKH